jgi:CYTH domain-containing protein
MMGVEIERKFLIEKDLWYAVKKPSGSSLQQAYLVNEKDKVIRIRVTDSSAFFTIKGPAVNFSRSEFEFQIPKQEALLIMDQFTKVRIDKTRYKVEYEGKTWEVDEFWGDNEGLILAEIELTSEDEEFTIPPWVGEEVTHDSRYYNAYLSEHPYLSWK